MGIVIVVVCLLIGLLEVVKHLSPPPSRVTEDVQYLYDARTDLCFATRYGGAVSASYVMVAIPCTPSVLVLARDREP